MDVSTQAHLTTLRDLLLYRRRELGCEIHAAELLRQQAASPQAVHEVSDGKDEAARRQGIAVETAQEQRDLDELALVDAALRRLDQGRYGDCADCGDPIPLPRLMAQPAALRCAACQVVFEHREAAKVSRAGV